jgi:hypothetical protein
MSGPLEQTGRHNGLGDPGLTRYALLLGRHAAWLLLGWWLYRHAAWPSTCEPVDLLAIYACSPRLPESGRWLESALLTWLWCTPLLLALEAARRWERTEPEVAP